MDGYGLIRTMEIIHLKEALDEMKKPVPFSISFVTCDIERKKGGDILKLDKCMLPKHEQNATENFGFAIPEMPRTDFKKNPDHYQHATRNVVLENGMKKKFHIRLLLEFNNKKVFY